MLIKGIPWKNIIKFALPLMLANVLQQLYNTADTIIAGNFISQNALAAIGSCMYITALYTAISIALGLGTGVVVSQFYGAKNIEEMKNSANVGIIISFIVGIVISIFSFLSGGVILKGIISVPDEIYYQSLIYVKLYSIGIVFQFCYNTFASILRAVGNSKSSLYFLLITTIINILLNVIFVLYFHFGVEAIAVATIISQFIAMIISYFYMIEKYPIFKFKYCFSKKPAKLILKTGVPLSLQALIVNCGFMIMQKLANSYGVEMTAAYSVACRLEIYLLIPLISILHAVSTFTGQNYGAKNFKKIVIGLKQTVKMNIILTLFLGSFTFLLAPKIIILFALKGNAYYFALANLRLVCIDLILYAMYSPVNGICIGIGKGYILSVISLIELSMRIIFTLILSNFIGISCLWWSEPFAWIVVVVSVYLYYNKILKKRLLK